MDSTATIIADKKALPPGDTNKISTHITNLENDARLKLSRFTTDASFMYLKLPPMQKDDRSAI